MRAIGAVPALTLAGMLVACSEPVGTPVEAELRLSRHSMESHNFGAPLSGSGEVPAVETLARGNAIFHLNHDGTELSYKLIVANIENILQAHIHCGASTGTGPVVVFLYPSAPPPVLIPGRFSGVLSEGVATQANVIPRPASPDCPTGVATLDDVVELLRTGGAYANVHTTANPSGEIRGQIAEHGPTK